MNTLFIELLPTLTPPLLNRTTIFISSKNSKKILSPWFMMENILKYFVKNNYKLGATHKLRKAILEDLLHPPSPG
jgi:hypothetical protein